MVLFLGDDWAEGHHDVELMDDQGRRLARARLSEDVAGLDRLHALIAENAGDGGAGDCLDVVVAIETGRGVWVQALLAAGYRVFAINPLQVRRYRGRQNLSGAKSDKADAHTLADIVRIDGHQLRPIGQTSDLAAAIKVVTRAHKSMISDRTRHLQRLRHALLAYFPAALKAYPELDKSDTWELLSKAPDPVSAAQLGLPTIKATLKRARRRKIDDRARQIQAELRREHLSQPDPIAQAHAAEVRSLVAVLVTLDEQIRVLAKQVDAHFGLHPDAEVLLSQPGLGETLAPRVLAEFGDDHAQYRSAKDRKNYAGTSPITRQSGKMRVVGARFIRNQHLIDALIGQAFAALTASPGARAYYDQLRAREIDHQAALRQLANRLVGISHGCLKHHARYDEETAWPSSQRAAA